MHGMHHHHLHPLTPRCLFRHLHLHRFEATIGDRKVVTEVKRKAVAQVSRVAHCANLQSSASMQTGEGDAETQQ